MPAYELRIIVNVRLMTITFYICLLFYCGSYSSKMAWHMFWLCHNVMCTLPALFIFVARYLCQYSDWATCWLTAETGFSSWWHKDFSCQHCVHPAFCPGVQGLLFSFEVKAVLMLMLSILCRLVSWAKRGWSFIFTRRPIVTVMLLFWTHYHKQLSFNKWETGSFWNGGIHMWK